MPPRAHEEGSFEAYIEHRLVTNGGYTRGDASDYDRKLALMPASLVAFVKETQPKKWVRLEKKVEDAKSQLLKSVRDFLNHRGTLEVFRKKVECRGVHFDLAYFEPGHSLNQDAWRLFEANRLEVVRQVKYDPKNENSLDMVLFLNGIPIVTVELKNQTTGQSVENAKNQYRFDRDPKAPIFRFKKRALVHFAVDTNEAWMTTKLSGASTFFLPFNKGHNGGAGNPPVKEKHRTHYLWEDVWERRSLLDIVGRFIHLQIEATTDPDTGKVRTSEKMIFPRYHQLDCVHSLIDASQRNGPGTNYLIQHSAGSGKSNSIAWLAHRLASLHDAEDEKIYDGVIVLTDRRVLDSQLQETIYQFDHKDGVVQKIEHHSGELAEALNAGSPIIISTIHKFGYIYDKVENLPDRNYAIIVDEAHSSQSGEMAVNVKAMLADSSLGKRVDEELDDADVETTTPDQEILRRALTRGKQPNMSFFAFTATPKHKTLAMFGHKVDGQPAPFHLYSMRQAIEEGFILDVLQGYTTYERFFELNRMVEADPEVDKKKAATALRRFVNLSPENIEAKTEIIVEHFRSCVAHLLDGRAKAMLVTGSRKQAVRYKLAFERYIEERGYHGLRCLVAFSGEVRDNGNNYTEPGMNDGIKESELPTKFASREYRILLVANKYQTGFDQPLLCAMYVDKRLSGIQAVQTLSRLNRMTGRPGQKQTFVLDFVNKREEILESFQDYYETTTIDGETDPDRLYLLKQELDHDFRILRQTEVDAFAKIFFDLPVDDSFTAHPKLTYWLEPAKDRFMELGEGEEGEDQQEDFRKKLSAFISLYQYLAQIISFRDVELEKFYAYGRLLLRVLPKRKSEKVELDDDVMLASLKIDKQAEGALQLAKGITGELPGPSATGTGSAKDQREKLSTIIEQLNEKYGLQLSERAADFAENTIAEVAANEEIQQQAEVNDEANFSYAAKPHLQRAIADRYEDHTEFMNQLYSDEELQKDFTRLMLAQIYLAARQQRQQRRK